MSNKKKLQVEQPIARTNMLKIHWDHESLIKALMSESDGGRRVLYQRLPIQREKRELDDDYYRRVDQGIKQFITQNLGAGSTVNNYERIAITKDNVLFFYLGNTPSNVEDLIQWHAEAGLSLDRAISAVLKLRLKISYLADASIHYDLTLRDCNSAFFIGAMEISDKEDSSVVDALECKVYYSLKGELALSMSSVTFKFEKKNTGVLCTGSGSVSLHKGSKQYLSGERLSATRYSKRPFMEFRLSEKLKDNPKFSNNGYQNSKNYHLTVCLNKIMIELDGIGVAYEPIEFQATTTLEEFVSAKPQLENELVIIDCFDRYPNDEIKQQFRDHLMTAFPASKIIGVENAPAAHQMQTQGVSYLVINPSSKRNGSSIVNQSTGACLNSFWKAFTAANKSKLEPTFDYYTNVKIARFVDQITIVCQGIDVESVIKTVTVKEGETSTKSVQMLELDANIIKKAMSELWLKESVFHRNQLIFTQSNMADGEYQLFYCRRTDDNLRYCEVVDVQVAGKTLMIIGTQRWRSDSAVIFDMTYPFLRGVAGNRRTEIFNAMHDQTFVLHEKSSGHSLISYSNGRIPKVIGNALFDNVELHSKSGIGRHKSAEQTPLPYYISPAQGGKMHRVYLQDNGVDGVNYFISGAKPTAGKIEKQNLIYNVLVFDSSGIKLPASEQSITKLFFSSFTYDILKNRNSAKKSILQKVAEMGLEN